MPLAHHEIRIVFRGALLVIGMLLGGVLLICLVLILDQHP